MEQLAQRGQGILRGHRAGVVHGLVAQAANHIHLGVHRVAYQLLKTGLEQVGRQIRLVRHAQAPTAPALGLVQPGHGQLQRAAGVKAGGARVGMGGGLGTAGFGQQVGPVGLEKAEVGWRHAHALSPCALCVGGSDQPPMSSVNPSPPTSNTNFSSEQRSGWLSASRMNEGLTLHTAAVCERVMPCRLRSVVRALASWANWVGVMCIL